MDAACATYGHDDYYYITSACTRTNADPSLIYKSRRDVKISAADLNAISPLRGRLLYLRARTTPYIALLYGARYTYARANDKTRHYTIITVLHRLILPVRGTRPKLRDRSIYYYYSRITRYVCINT